MREINYKQIICLILVSFFLIATNISAISAIKNPTEDDIGVINSLKEIKKPISANTEPDDLDPLVDIELTFTVKHIRALDKIDLFSEPDFYVKVFINDVEYESPLWKDQQYVFDPWSVTVDVPDEEENVTIKIQLWDWDSTFGIDRLCDISTYTNQDPIDIREVNLVYSLKAGHWRGDDYNSLDTVGDLSGYGRLNGCDDNSIYIKDRDCELLFDITQTDPDGDGIPYWTEVEEFGTDPEVNDTGMDDDGDGVPIEWEHKWGHYFGWDQYNDIYTSYWLYDPFVSEDHANLDPDVDGLQNIEEYLTSQWGSDPFRQDIFLELDQMEITPDAQCELAHPLSKEVVRDSFAKQNIVFQIDDGCMGGGEIIPYDDDHETDEIELQQYYMDYFLHGDVNNWRRGVFHWAVSTYFFRSTNGWTVGAFAFSSKVNGTEQTDSFYFSQYCHRVPHKPYLYWAYKHGSFNYDQQRKIFHAGVIMHELGHTLGINRGNTPGCDNKNTLIFGIGWLKYRSYRSCMNYNYVYQIIDYSDGSRGRNDFDDWARIDLARFENTILRIEQKSKG